MLDICKWGNVTETTILMISEVILWSVKLEIALLCFIPRSIREALQLSLAGCGPYPLGKHKQTWPKNAIQTIIHLNDNGYIHHIIGKTFSHGKLDELLKPNSFNSNILINKLFQNFSNISSLSCTKCRGNKIFLRWLRRLILIQHAADHSYCRSRV